jgi:rSAM/selenodomain-associated transferase 2
MGDLTVGAGHARDIMASCTKLTRLIRGHGPLLQALTVSRDVGAWEPAHQPKFSIIIPTLNEEKTIQSCLLALQPLRADCEIIVVDGGSTDNTKILARPLADKVITSAKGRARQMNSGARRASGEVLIFLHADTRLPENALPSIQREIGGQRQWGRFDIQLSGTHFMLKVIAWMMNQRSRLTGIATGDQVIFAARAAFEAVGHYPEISLMEDIALSKTLKKTGPPICLKDKAVSSGRRWEHNGVYKTIVLMWSLRLRYFLGADPQILAFLYTRGVFTRCKFSDCWARIYPRRDFKVTRKKYPPRIPQFQWLENGTRMTRIKRIITDKTLDGMR